MTLRPMDMMKPFIGRSRVNRNNPRSATNPSAPTNIIAPTSATKKFTPELTRNQVIIPPTIRNSPCAKLTIPASPKINVIPIPMSIVTLATERLFTSCWMNISIFKCSGRPLEIPTIARLATRIAGWRSRRRLLHRSFELVGRTGLDNGNLGRKCDLVMWIESQGNRRYYALIFHLENRIYHCIWVVERADLFQRFGVHEEVIVIEKRYR